MDISIKMLRGFLGFFIFIVSSSHAAQTISFDKMVLIDLSHSFSKETIYWPTSPIYQLKSLFKGKTQKGYYYEANALCTAEHGGTHLDAPIHFYQKGESVEQIPLTHLMGSAVVINVSNRAKEDRDLLVDTQDLKIWEQKHGKIPPKSIVLIRTDFSKYWPNKKTYLGTEEHGQEAVLKLHFPGLHPQAAQWLVQKRKIKAVGIDTASIDYGQSKLFKSHQVLTRYQIPIFENLTNLDQLPAKNAVIIALPMKIEGGSGAPLRAVAFVQNSFNSLE